MTVSPRLITKGCGVYAYHEWCATAEDVHCMFTTCYAPPFINPAHRLQRKGCVGDRAAEVTAVSQAVMPTAHLSTSQLPPSHLPALAVLVQGKGEMQTFFLKAAPGRSLFSVAGSASSRVPSR
jgi:hypothetical protein